MKIIIATIKSWNIARAEAFRDAHPEVTVRIVREKTELTPAMVRDFAPDYVFFPHWSWKIPAEIYENFPCVVFHMTDLPFGRGGSPLQNLLVRGIYETKVSALKVCEAMDAGDIYRKCPLNIETGSAGEILDRVSALIFEEMLPAFLQERPTPQPQTGTVVEFARRTPAESELPEDLTPRGTYDFIRMLDGEGYPTAFVNTPAGKMYLTDARLKDDVVSAQARFGE